MSDPGRSIADLAPEQRSIRAKCIHPTGASAEFKKEEIEQSVPHRFEKIVGLYPQRLAVKANDHSLTYEALNQAANRIARAILAKRGQGNEPIALLFQHGIDAIAAILGTLKAGKIYVALDPSFPQEKITYILRDSEAGLIVTNNRNVNLARSLTKDTRTLLNTDEMGNSFSSDNLCLAVAPDEIAHLIYTSGSTGAPKGVVHSHRTYLHRAMEYTNEMHICPDDRLSLLHSVSFGSSRLNLFQSLLTGASLFPFDVKSEGIHRLARWLKEEEITICHLAPALFRQLADFFSGEESLPNLRVIHLSGAPITQLDLELYRKNFFPRTALRIYMGTTETVEVCSYVVEPSFSFPEEGVPVGYAVPGKKILLLDENSREVGANQVGEIAIQSRYLTRGYWRKPELTRCKFLPDPGGGEERIYLTGDLGRMLPDGFLVHIGRKDFQVNVRGYRVEPGEVEMALLAHAGVKELVVVGREDQPGDARLIAYFIPAGHPAPTVTELRSFLKEKLPNYMIPSAFVMLRAFPLTPNGKVDRSALPVPEDTRPDLDAPFAAPRTVVEEDLAEIWAEVLSLDHVGIHDNFFDLGGHSLTATRIISQVIKRFQLELPIQSLFESPTVAEMAAVITQSQAKNLGEKELEQLLAELESLSDNEAQVLVSGRKASSHSKRWS